MKNFIFKKLPQDFIVEEKLWELPKWAGPVFYVLFEKKNKTTFEIIFDLMKRFNLQRSNIWIAWLKDKVGITRQRLTVYKRYLEQVWWKQNFLDAISKNAKILRTWRSDKTLTMWSNRGNLFFIRLRNFKKSKQHMLEWLVDKISKNWVPNYFGEQRFWAHGKNWLIWRDLLLGKKSTDTHNKEKIVEDKFRLQALASHVFNEYVWNRIYKWLFDKILPWDILYNEQTQEYKIPEIWNTKIESVGGLDIREQSIRVDLMESEKLYTWDDLTWFWPTWPIIWFNMLVGSPYHYEGKWQIVFDDLSDAIKLEIDTLKKIWLSMDDIIKFKKFDIFWLRRSIKIFPKDLRYKIDDKKWDLLIMFELPSGCYASVVVEYLDELLW